MQRKWKETQVIELTMNELLVWWDWLDSVKDTPEEAFVLFTKFLEQCTDQLEDKSIDDIDDLFNDTEEYGIPFTPRHSF